MQTPSNILEEVKRHDLEAFKRLDTSHYGVLMALEYLDKNAQQQMAQRLRQLIDHGNLRIGPLEGFVAAAVSLSQGDFIFLSDLYPKYSTAIEVMASVVGEIGSFKEFNCSSEDNELRSLAAVSWMKEYLSKPSGGSIITNIRVPKNPLMTFWLKWALFLMRN